MLAGSRPDRMETHYQCAGPLLNLTDEESEAIRVGLQDRNLCQILRSGGQAKRPELCAAERLANLLALFRTLGSRIFWLTMLDRVTESAKAALVFAPLETRILNRLAANRQKAGATVLTIPSRLRQLTHFGGMVDRTCQP